MKHLYAYNDIHIEALLLDPDYEVRLDGTIWSLIQRTGKRGVKTGWRRIDRIDQRGYREVRYNYKRLLVHRIIYAKYKGKLDPALLVRHLDDNPLNNEPANLELGTVAQNNKDAYKNGRCINYGNAKINFEIAQQIRADKRDGAKHRELQAKYGLCKGSISEIVNNKIWIKP